MELIEEELNTAKINDKVQELIYMLDLVDPVFATAVLTTALVHFLERQKDVALSKSVVDYLTDFLPLHFEENKKNA
jgi:hypothetical protein